ncbi:hypothetical protein BJ742DRAFT_830630 [Cladochytrium replicatum]|nr:hypothetical protein BJ742DRAFT_830630 [Cladochytrium replicatum]
MSQTLARTPDFSTTISTDPFSALNTDFVVVPTLTVEKHHHPDSHPDVFKVAHTQDGILGTSISHDFDQYYNLIGIDRIAHIQIPEVTQLQKLDQEGGKCDNEQSGPSTFHPLNQAPKANGDTVAETVLAHQFSDVDLWQSPQQSQLLQLVLGQLDQGWLIQNQHKNNNAATLSQNPGDGGRTQFPPIPTTNDNWDPFRSQPSSSIESPTYAQLWPSYNGYNNNNGNDLWASPFSLESMVSTLLDSPAPAATPAVGQQFCQVFNGGLDFSQFPSFQGLGDSDLAQFPSIPATNGLYPLKPGDWCGQLPAIPGQPHFSDFQTCLPVTQINVDGTLDNIPETSTLSLRASDRTAQIASVELSNTVRDESCDQDSKPRPARHRVAKLDNALSKIDAQPSPNVNGTTEYQLTYNDLLRIVFAIVSTTKKHHCDYPGCTSQFSRSYNLQQHKLTHDRNRERKHPCTHEGCTHSFDRAADLANHVKNGLHGVQKRRARNATAVQSAFEAKVRAVLQDALVNLRVTCSGNEVESIALTRDQLLTLVDSVVQDWKEKEKVHQCGVCGHETTREYNLKMHSKTHTAQRERFECGDCGKSFVNQGNLSRHVNAGHGDGFGGVSRKRGRGDVKKGQDDVLDEHNQKRIRLGR